MKRVAIVGVEGSGKTVLMAVMGEKYEVDDCNGILLQAQSEDTYSYCKELTAYLREGKWPFATSPEKVQELNWDLKYRPDRSKSPMLLGSLNFMDFAGEIYRLAFAGRGEEEQEQKKLYAAQLLKKQVDESDILLVLVNLSDIINARAADKRTIEMGWLSQAILSYTFAQNSRKKVAIVFTQADSYIETIRSCGSLQGALNKYLGTVEANFGNYLKLFAVAAVNKTELDETGHPIPAPDFQPEGLENLMAWIVNEIDPFKVQWGKRFFVALAWIFLLVWSFAVFYNGLVHGMTISTIQDLSITREIMSLRDISPGMLTREVLFFGGNCIVMAVLGIFCLLIAPLFRKKKYNVADMEDYPQI